jgi:hypothetical protein
MDATVWEKPRGWNWVATLLPWAVAAMLVAGIYATTPNFRWRDDAAAAPFGGDFLQEWIGGYLVASGNADRLYDADYTKQLQHDPAIIGYRWSERRYLPMVYPPYYYAGVRPLATLSSVAATLVWAGLMVAALGFALVVCRRLAGWNAAALGWVAVLALVFPPLVENLITSQKATVLLLLFAATYALLRAGSPFFAGVAFGLVAFKPQLAAPIAVMMLCKRQWRFVLGGATTGVVLLLVSLATSWQACEDYVRFALGTGSYLQSPGYDLAKAHNWRGFFTLLADGQASAWEISLATLVACFATLFFAWRLFAGPFDAASDRFPRQFAGLMIATVLVSPHLLTYDLTILLLPVLLLATGSASRPRAAAVIYAACAVSTPLVGILGLQVSVLVLAGAQAHLALAAPHRVVLLQRLPGIRDGTLANRP